MFVDEMMFFLSIIELRLLVLKCSVSWLMFLFFWWVVFVLFLVPLRWWCGGCMLC